MRLIHGIFMSLAAVMPLLVAGCSHSDPRTQALIDLRDELEGSLEELNAGDWVVIGPTTEMEQAATDCKVQHINVLASNVSTLRETIDLMESNDKLSPRLWVCRELEQSTYKNSTPGNARLRKHLKELLMGRMHFSVDERVISLQLKLLDTTRKALFIHTDTTLPHSSIGIELDYAGQSNTPPHSTTPKPTYHQANIES